MKATIIGGHGFIGKGLLKRLTHDGWECWVPDRDDPELFKKDLGYVFYCAGLTADYAARTFDTVNAHVCLLNAVIHNAQFKSLVYLSSTRIYDNTNCSIATEDISLTLNPHESRHLYDLSKALGESVCLVAGKDKAKVARLSCVYNNQEDEDGFLPNLLRQVLTKSSYENSTIILESSINFARDYVHLYDVINSLILIATKGNQQIYNVASGENTTNKKLFLLLEQLSGRKIIANKNESKPPPQISIEKMRLEFNWKPTSVEDKLKLLFLERN
jgi:nucleoside-diphosphate-sugar epimerase